MVSHFICLRPGAKPIKFFFVPKEVLFVIFAERLVNHLKVCLFLKISCIQSKSLSLRDFWQKEGFLRFFQKKGKNQQKFSALRKGRGDFERPPPDT